VLQTKDLAGCQRDTFLSEFVAQNNKGTSDREEWRRKIQLKLWAREYVKISILCTLLNNSNNNNNNNY
jgi:hypothetical protein